MGNSSSSISPLRQRMIDDMTMRRLSDKTQISYIRHVRELSEYLGQSPHKLPRKIYENTSSIL